MAKRSESSDRAVALVAPELDDAIHNLLRWFLAPILLKKSSFLLHASGVVKDGKGYVFFGQSGAGKSTSAELIRRADSAALVVGDDSVIVEHDGAQAWLHSAPLGCGYSSEAPPAVRVPLAGIYALEQAAEDRVEELTAASGVSRILASAMCNDFSEELESRFALAQTFATIAPRIWKLCFKKTPEFWDLVQAHADWQEEERSSK